MGSTNLYYEIIVKEQIDRRSEERFEDMKLQVSPDGNTIISGYVADQAALYRVLNKLRASGFR